MAQKYSVSINAVFFKYSKLKSGEQILVRTVLVPDDVFKPTLKKWTEAQLIEIAEERKSRELVNICKELIREEYLWDKASRTYGGSFRFWGHRHKGGKARMVMGLNVSGDRCATPEGQLDIWIPVKSLAEISGCDEPGIRKFLQNFSQVGTQSGIDVVIRVKTTSEAERLVIQMKKWLEVKESNAGQ